MPTRKTTDLGNDGSRADQANGGRVDRFLPPDHFRTGARRHMLTSPEFGFPDD